MSEKKTKRGRKPFELTPELIAEAERMASVGLMDKEIYAAMGISRDVFYKRKRYNKEFKDALARGRSRGHEAVASKLYEVAMTGNVSALTFYLARRCGWTEKQEEKHEEGKSKPITIQFVDAPKPNFVEDDESKNSAD